MKMQHLNLGDKVPVIAREVFLLFEIEPPTATVTVYGYASGVFPTVLRGKGSATVKLVTSQTLSVETSADVTKHDITVAGYSIY
jgi:hypothetical protein